MNPVRPWVTADEDCRDDMAAIVGALPLEVAIMNSLTANLHFLLAAFYRPTPTRYRILMEGKAFPSDKFALQSQGKRIVPCPWGLRVTYDACATH